MRSYKHPFKVELNSLDEVPEKVTVVISTRGNENHSQTLVLCPSHSARSWNLNTTDIDCKLSGVVSNSGDGHLLHHEDRLITEDGIHRSTEENAWIVSEIDR